jgi:hypothetical protein
MARSIPRADADFNFQQKVIVDMAKENLARYGIPVKWFRGKLLKAQKEWERTYGKSKDVATRSRVDTVAKTSARAQYEPLLSQLIKIIKGNPDIPQAELVAAGIALSKGRGNKRNAPPGDAPSTELNTTLIRHIIILFWEFKSLLKGRPKNARGAEVRWVIADENPGDLEALIHWQFVTHSPFRLEFEECDRGKWVWFCVRWVGTGGEPGPWGMIQSVMIP